MARMIDEAIKHERKEAKECRDLILVEKNLEPQESHYCLCLEQTSKEHEQLADWLEELKSYREIGTVEECKDVVENIERFYRLGYKKGIDDCIKRIKIASENCVDEKGWFNVHISYFDDLAQHLKEGDTDGD